MSICYRETALNLLLNYIKCGKFDGYEFRLLTPSSWVNPWVDCHVTLSKAQAMFRPLDRIRTFNKMEKKYNKGFHGEVFMERFSWSNVYVYI